MSMNEKKLNQIGVGLIVLFGLPAIGYMYCDWFMVEVGGFDCPLTRIRHHHAE